MGAFDYVVCEFPLKYNPPIKFWQTKHFDCEYNVLRILAHGVLQRAEVHYVPDDPESDVTDDDFEWFDYSGELELSDSGYRYKLKFHAGLLVKVVCLDAPQLQHAKEK